MAEIAPQEIPDARSLARDRCRERPATRTQNETRKTKRATTVRGPLRNDQQRVKPSASVVTDRRELALLLVEGTLALLLRRNALLLLEARLVGILVHHAAFAGNDRESGRDAGLELLEAQVPRLHNAPP